MFMRRLVGACKSAVRTLPCWPSFRFSLPTIWRDDAVGYGNHPLDILSGHAVRRHQAQALADHPLERGWLSARERQRHSQAYAMADRIRVATTFARHTFADTGFPAACGVPVVVTDRTGMRDMVVEELPGTSSRLATGKCCSIASSAKAGLPASVVRYL